MADYVMLGSGVADLLNAAQQVRDKGDQLTKTMKAAVNRINELDVPATFPPDEFTNSFLNGKDGGYHSLVDSGTDAGKVPTNEAVKASGLQLGPAAVTFGDRALDAMWAYTATDDDNATNIGNAGAV